MKNSLKALKEANIVPKLRLFVKVGKVTKATGPHRVKLIADKEVEGQDYESGKKIIFMRYLVEENGEKRVYQTKKLNKEGELSYLVQRLAECPEGVEVILSGDRRGVRNYVSVTPVDPNAHAVEVDEDMEEDQVVDDGHEDINENPENEPK